MFKENYLDILDESWYQIPFEKVLSITGEEEYLPESMKEYVVTALKMAEDVPRRRYLNRPERSKRNRVNGKKYHEVEVLCDFIIEEVLTHENNQTVIDVGCGKGYLSLELAERLPKGSTNFILVDGQHSNIAAVRKVVEEKKL